MRHRILLVEDDADDRYIMHQAFSELNYVEQVKVFDSGEEIFNYLKKLPHHSFYPSLLVLDYNMPGMNGGEVLMRLKMHESLSAIPVAMYSTGMRQLESKLRSLGAAYCFEKGNRAGEVYMIAEKLKSIAEGIKVIEEK